MTACILCRGAEGHAELGRFQVWEDDLWRLTTSIHPTETVEGFSFLEPKRHIPDITALGGEEAATFGAVVGKVTSALKDVTRAELVYVYVFGGHLDHLHLHLGPHTEVDPLNDSMIPRGVRRGTPPERRRRDRQHRLPFGAGGRLARDRGPDPPAPRHRVNETPWVRLAAWPTEPSHASSNG